MKVKFGIIGYGFMGHIHVDKLLTIKEAEVVAICDNDPDKLKDAPEGIKLYKDIDELLKDGEINTVIIAIPNHLHLEAVKKAAYAQKHIICEKPVAMNVKELDEMIKVIKDDARVE